MTGSNIFIKKNIEKGVKVVKKWIMIQVDGELFIRTFILASKNGVFLTKTKLLIGEDLISDLVQSKVLYFIIQVSEKLMSGVKCFSNN